MPAIQNVQEQAPLAAVYFMDLPVILPDSLGSDKLVACNSQWDFGAYIGCHPCFEDQKRVTTVYLHGGIKMNVLVPFDQFAKQMQLAGKQLANMAAAATPKILVPRGGGV